MSVSKLNFSLNTTDTSSAHSDNIQDITTVKVKNGIKDLLKSRLFLGRYLERRLTNQHIGYRDIIVVSNAEVDLKRDLVEVRQRLLSLYPSSHWIGISDGESIGYSNSICMWTEIDNQPFGPFWFQIKSVKFRDEEVLILLKCLRHISDSFLELEPFLTGSVKKAAITNVANADKPVASTEALSETYNEFMATLKSFLSIRNVKEFVVFVVALVIAIFTGSTAFITFLGNFVLALLREVSILIKNSTPMFLGFLDFISKLVGGFYILMAMMFKPSPAPPSRGLHRYNSHRRSIEYGSRNFD